MFIAVLFTITKTWKKPKGPSVVLSVDKTTMGHLHSGILFGHKKEENFTLCDSMDGHREHYAKENKPEREKQTPYDFTHM